LALPCVVTNPARRPNTVFTFSAVIVAALMTLLSGLAAFAPNLEAVAKLRRVGSRATGALSYDYSPIIATKDIGRL